MLSETLQVIDTSRWLAVFSTVFLHNLTFWQNSSAAFYCQCSTTRRTSFCGSTYFVIMHLAGCMEEHHYLVWGMPFYQENPLDESTFHFLGRNWSCHFPALTWAWGTAADGQGVSSRRTAGPSVRGLWSLSAGERPRPALVPTSAQWPHSQEAVLCKASCNLLSELGFFFFFSLPCWIEFIFGDVREKKKNWCSIIIISNCPKLNCLDP